jgi:predicted HTH transcriptional regulator
MTPKDLQSQLDKLLRLDSETEWVEFKRNNEKPEEIGEYISAISNGAALHGKKSGYVVWGVESGTHKVVGTTFQPKRRKIGAEELENWLLRLLSPE